MQLSFLPKSLLVSSLLFCSVAQGEFFAPPITLTAEQNYTTNPDQSLVKVSGQVNHLPAADQPSLMQSNFTIIGSDARQSPSGLQPAAGVKVRFWQPDSPGIYYTTETDEKGHYLIGLSEGVWLGEACGSGIGFYPAAWQLSIVDEKLVSMQAVSQKLIQLNPLQQDLFDRHPQQQTVTLTGSGFGCNGALVFSYSNAVNSCGIAQPVEYDQEVIRVSDFSYRSDTELRFPMPELHPDSDVMRHIASVHYEQGNISSQGVVIGERVMARLPGSLCSGGDFTEKNRGILQDDVVVTSSGRVAWRASQTTNWGQSFLGEKIIKEGTIRDLGAGNITKDKKITTQDIGVETTIREVQGVGLLGNWSTSGLQLKLRELR